MCKGEIKTFCSNLLSIKHFCQFKYLGTVSEGLSPQIL